MLDHLHALAEAMRKAEPRLTPQQALLKAVQTPEGRTTYALYSLPPQLLAKATLNKAGARKPALDMAARKAAAPPKNPAEAIYAAIAHRAIAEASAGTPKPHAIADFLNTNDGQQMWAQYNAARRLEAG